MKKPLVFLLVSVLAAPAAQAQWASQPVPFSRATYYPASLQAVDASAAWAIASNPSGLFTPAGIGTTEVARTTDGGASWRTGTVPGLAATEVITSLTAQSATTAWLTTTGDTQSQVLRTTDGGATWQPRLTLGSKVAERSLDYVCFFDADHGLCLGNPDNGDQLVVYTTADGGATWAATPGLPPLASTGFNYLVALSPPVVVGAHIWVATTSSQVFHSADRGLTWTVSAIVPASTTPNGPKALAFSDEQHGLALFSRTDGFTNGQPLYQTADGGATWQPVAFSGPLHGSNLARVPGTSTYLSVGENLPFAGVPADAGSSFSRDGGATWMALESTDNHQLLSAAGPLAIWSSSYDYPTGLSNGVRKLTSLALPTRAAALASPLRAYPNPSPDGHFTLVLPAAASGAQVQVLDALGREVARAGWGDGTPGAHSLSLAGQPAGCYTVRVRTTAGVATQRLCVQ